MRDSAMALFRGALLMFLACEPIPVASAGIESEEIVVIVNGENPADRLSRTEIVNIFMGRMRSFATGEPVLPLDHASDSPIRREYYSRLVNKSVAQINAYWAKLLFTGKLTPPQVLEGSEPIVRAVNQNRSAVGYVPRSAVGSGVKIVYTLK